MALRVRDRRAYRFGVHLTALVGVCCVCVQPSALAQRSNVLSGGAAAELDGPGTISLSAIHVTEIRVIGSSVLTDAEIGALAAFYEGRDVTFEELNALRHALSAAYFDRGYVNSGVVLPDQQVDGGVVVFEAVEGKLSEIEIEGNRRLKDRAVARRIEAYLDEPLDIAELRQSLSLLEDDALVAQINAELLPGEAPGESFLRLAVVEEPPFELDFAVNNHRPASVGEDQGRLALTYRGLVGNGDAIRALIGITEGANDYALSYSVPLTAKGAMLDVYGSDQESDIIEAPFDGIDITSRLESWGVTATIPFTRASNASVVGIAGFEHKKSESTLLGMPFSFSPGEIDGRAEGSRLMLGAEWTRRTSAQAFALRGLVHIGVDALDATIHDGDLADSEFTAVQAQFQYLRNIAWRDSRLLVQSTVQAAADPLLAMYKLPVGGRFSVRGYRENQLVRDNGATASIEYQFAPLVDDLGVPRQNFNIAVFVDYGVSFDDDDRLATSRREKLYSAGLGLLWSPVPAFRAEFYWGADLADVHNNGDSLQDDGLHYALSFRKAF